MQTSCSSRITCGLVYLALVLFHPGAATCADPSPTGFVTFQWAAPTHSIEGQPLTEPARFKVHWGLSSGQYTRVIDTGMQTSCTVTGLARDCVYYFAVTAYETNGAESAFSSELSWAFGDVDVDGLQDAWEAAYFGGTQGAQAAPGTDVDGDGMSNYEEFIAGSDPTDAASACRVYAGVAGESPRVSFLAVAAAGAGYTQYQRIYDLEACDPMDTPLTWQPVAGRAGIVGAGQMVAHIVSAPDTHRTRLFRARSRLALQ